MLHYLPHPQTLLLCDIYKKENALQVLRQEIIDKYGFQGDIRLLYSDREVPQEFYDATLMIGATNAPDILQIDKLQPGTVLIDDSGPHCLNANLAFERFNQRHDILMTEGGKLQLPQPIKFLIFMPNALSPAMQAGIKAEAAFEAAHTNEIMGCVFSSILCHAFPELPPNIGLVDEKICMQYFEALTKLNIQAASLQYEYRALDPLLVQQFYQVYGGNSSAQLLSHIDSLNL